MFTVWVYNLFILFRLLHIIRQIITITRRKKRNNNVVIGKAKHRFLINKKNVGQIYKVINKHRSVKYKHEIVGIC